MTTEKQTDSEEKISIFKKICLGLQSSDRKVRKQTYLDTEIYLSKDIDFTDQELRVLFTETYIYLLNGLRDKTEAVREQAIKFITFLIIHKLPLNDFYLTYVFPVIVERIGTVELIEESEEVRLQMLQLLNDIITRYSNTVQLKPFLNDCVIILCETVKDKFPSIKELSCSTIIKLAAALPRDFHNQAEVLIAPVLSCFGHQRYKVRVEAICAIGEIVMHSSYKGLDETVGPLAERLFDQIPAVRRAVGKVAGRWLLEYRDRYSFFHKILPLLLTGLNDEVLETRMEAAEIWEKVGMQFQNENEKDLKDELDYLVLPPKHYPPHVKQRPNVGCRALVKRNISKMAPALARELAGSWQEDVRVRCGQLLCALALHAEADIAQTLPALLPAMYAAARYDQDGRVVDNVVVAGEILGCFVGYDTWSALVLPTIDEGPHYGHLTVLRSLVRGSPAERIAECVEEIGKALAEDSVCCSRKKNYQLEMVRCVQALVEKHTHGTNNSTGYYLFKIIVIQLSLKHPEIDGKIIEDVLDELRASLELKYNREMWDLYTGRLLTEIGDNPRIWTTVSDHECVFLTVLSRCEEAFGKNLDAIGNILREVLDTEGDAESRLKTFYVLATVFEKKDVIFKDAVGLAVFLEKLIEVEIFVPSLVWHAGATAEAIRTMAASCLQHALTPSNEVELFSTETLRPLSDKLLPLLVSLLEDASWRSRQIAVDCLTLLGEEDRRKEVWRVEDLVAVYPEILKRLDDPTEKVRLCALRNLPVILRNVPPEFKSPHYKAHHELIIDTLLTHFDDDDEQVQELVYDVLEAVALINKKELLDKMERHKPMLRNQKGCDRIIRNFESLKIEEIDC
ncbi:unnamed protein product [Phaedon cochleariae]|uniref:TOG domain-containing protein n=1 Tax=Phaedon cochleariae TaxID=80249 RepID=A0A9N9X3K6_PHACE|nr:unnamed protein product [Phaedon cochleariae]